MSWLSWSAISTSPARLTPPEDVHALDLDGLLDETVTLFSLREKGALLGIGAIKTLDESHMELKSIHTADTESALNVAPGALTVSPMIKNAARALLLLM